MSFKFSQKSLDRLDTCHTDIQTIMNEVITLVDFTILEGHRSAEKQMEYYKKGLSKLDGVNKKSNHQAYPSMAIDIMPYYKGFNPFTDRNGHKSFYYLAGVVKATADKLYENGDIAHKLVWGGNWDDDMDFFGDTTFFDLPHFELR